MSAAPRPEVVDLVRRTTTASGVPERLEDDVVASRVATILRGDGANAGRETTVPKGGRSLSTETHPRQVKDRGGRRARA
jgi:hypothetical protein